MAKGSMTAAALVCALLAGGCATTQLPPADAGAVPADRLLLKPAASADATIVVVRDSGFLGKGCMFGLYVNRQLAARFEAGEKATFKVPAGEVLLSVGRDPMGQALCSPGVDPTLVTRETMLKPGETKHFRLALTQGGPDIMRSDF